MSDFYGGGLRFLKICGTMLTAHVARNEWEPTWGAGNERGLTVKSVKMWQEGKCQ
jgi:hypothetical protein